MSKNRMTKHDYYLNIAKAVSLRGTCMRRIYGAVIVNNDEIIATGYNGAVRGEDDCLSLGQCERDRLQIAQGTRYELCKSVHAEENAIISAARRDMIGSTIYLFGIDGKTGLILEKNEPCAMCLRRIKNSGINKIVSLEKEGDKMFVKEVDLYLEGEVHKYESELF